MASRLDPPGNRLPDFPWDRLIPYAATARAHPDGLCDLSVGTPVDPTPAVVQDALRAAADSPGYPTTLGTAALREAAAVLAGTACRRGGGRPGDRGAADRRLQGAGRAAAAAGRRPPGLAAALPRARLPDLRRGRPAGRRRTRAVRRRDRGRPDRRRPGLAQLPGQPVRRDAARRHPQGGGGLGP